MFSPETILESGNIALKNFEKRLALDDDIFNVVFGFHIIVSVFVTKAFQNQSVTWIKCVVYIEYGESNTFCCNSFQHDCNESPHCTPYSWPSVLHFFDKVKQRYEEWWFFVLMHVFCLLFFLEHPYHHFDFVLNLQIHFNHSNQERLHLQKTWFVQAMYAESVKRF